MNREFFSRHERFCVFLILLLTLGSLFFWGSRKEGYHVDEMYMYGTANSAYLPFMHLGAQEYSVRDWMADYGAGENLLHFGSNLARDISILNNCSWNFKESEIYTNYLRAQKCSNDMYHSSWLSGEDYRNYLAASEHNRFNYISVYYNFRGDNHPPLYAMLLHTICSFFPGTFSKWFGLGLNMVIITLTVLFLYTTVKKYLGGTLPALAVAACYGLSAAAANTSTFIRMYSLLSLMVVGMVYAHLRLQAADWKMDKKDRRILFFFTLFGYLSQFYFVFFAFGIVLAAVIILLTRKKFKELLRYLITLALSALAGIILWPFSLKAVFSGTRGQSSISGLFSLEGTLERLDTMLDVLVHGTLGIPSLLFPLFLILAGILLLFLCKKDSRDKKQRLREKVLLCALPFWIFFLTVSKMIPYLVDRYIMCIFPWCFVLFLGAVVLLLRKSPLPEKWQTIAFLIVSCILLITSDSFRLGNGYLFPGGQENDKVAENTDCIYILPENWWNQSAEDTLLLSQCRNVAVVREGEFDYLDRSYAPEGETKLLFIVRDGLNADLDVLQLLAMLPQDGVALRFEEISREHSRDRQLISYNVIRKD